MTDKQNSLKDLVYKKPLFLLFLLLFVFVSYDLTAAECREFYYTSTNGGNQRNYDVYYSDVLPLESCTESVVMTGVEYARLKVLDDQNNQVNLITAEMATTSFMFGLSSYLIFWFIGYKGRMGRQLVKQI